jgi:GH15 family glucan-1,4-alpha-glucosidase
MQAVRDQLWCKTDIGGVARYTNDYYHQVETDLAKVPGNPWFICTMWLGQHAVARAKRAADLEPARQILSWVAARQMPSGVLAEQVHPRTGAPLSVAPLTWSHATVVTLVQEYLDRCEALELKAPGSQRRYRKLKSYERPEPEIPLDGGPPQDPPR